MSQQGDQGHSSANDFSEHSQVRLNSIETIDATRTEAEPRNYFIQNQDHTVVLGQFSGFSKLGLVHEKKAPFAHKRFQDEAGKLPSDFSKGFLEVARVIKASESNFIDTGWMKACRLQ